MEIEQEHIQRMASCLEMACDNVKHGKGGPFAAIVVKEGKIIGKGVNRVTEYHDPTAHAEVLAIRDACNNLGDFRLEGAILYTSCEPCPMCLGAIYWSHIQHVVYAADRYDAASIGFDDARIYEEVNAAPDQRSIHFQQLKLPQNMEPFLIWNQMPGKVTY